MRLEQVLKDVLKKEEGIAKTEKERAERKENSEWRAIFIAFRYPELGPKQMWNELSEEWKLGYSYEQMYEDMSAVNLDNKEKRNRMLQYAKESAEILYRALDGDQVAAMEYAQLTENFDERDPKNRKLFFKAKYLVVYLAQFDTRFQKYISKDILYYYGNKYCKRLFWNMRNKINQKLEIKYDRKAMNFLENARKDIEKSEEKLGNLNKEEKLEQLEFLNDSYRNALELAENRFEEMQSVLESAAEEAKTKAVTDFYSQMNSSKYGNLLDGLLAVEDNIKRAKKEKVALPPAYVPLSIFFRQMIRFVKESGVKPVKEVGTKMKVTLSDVSGMNYEGSSFETEEDVKEVVIVTPGWEYEGNLIAVPSVKEVQDC